MIRTNIYIIGFVTNLKGDRNSHWLEYHKSKQLENQSFKIIASKWSQVKKKQLFVILDFIEFVYRYHNLRYLKRQKECVIFIIFKYESKCRIQTWYSDSRYFNIVVAKQYSPEYSFTQEMLPSYSKICILLFHITLPFWINFVKNSQYLRWNASKWEKLKVKHH